MNLDDFLGDKNKDGRPDGIEEYLKRTERSLFGFWLLTMLAVFAIIAGIEYLGILWAK